MTAALADTDTNTDTAEDTERTCDCRYLDGQCDKPAVWVYRMACCAGSTFVCSRCRHIHKYLGDQKIWMCRWCAKRGTLTKLVASMRML